MFLISNKKGLSLRKGPRSKKYGYGNNLEALKNTKK